MPQKARLTTVLGRILAKDWRDYAVSGFCISALIFGVLADDLPYSYFVLLRFVVCAVSIHLAVKRYRAKPDAWVWIFGANAVLFNPILPVRMERSDWEMVDLLDAALFTFWIGMTLYSRYKRLDLQIATRAELSIASQVGGGHMQKEEHTSTLARPNPTLSELAGALFQAVLDPRADSRDWDRLKAIVKSRERYRIEWFAFRSFIALGVAASVLDPRVQQALMKTYFGTLPAWAPLPRDLLEDRIGRYSVIYSSQPIRLPYGAVAEISAEFARLTCFDAANKALLAFADATSVGFGRDQLTRLLAYRDGNAVAGSG